MSLPLEKKDSSRELDTLRFLNEADVRAVREQFGTPTFVYDEASIAARVEYFKNFPNAFGLTVLYSIKACASGAILKLINQHGVSFDASSSWEAKRALAVGVRPEKILLTAQELTSNIEELLHQGVQYNAGSPGQIEFYGKRFPGTEISLRLNPGKGSGFINRLTSGGAKSSFGIWHEQLPQVKPLLEKYGLHVKRFHHHIGSGHDPMEWGRISAQTLTLAKQFGPVPIINLGGGYPVKVLNTDPEPDYTEIGEVLRKNFLLYAEETGVEPKLEIEPGTAMMANSGSLVTTCTDVVSTGKDGFTFIKIDSGLTELLRPGFYGAEHPLVRVGAEEGERAATKEYIVAGHCCVAGDVLTTEKKNPENLAPRLLAETTPGDLIVVERAGGYCASMCVKNFNSFPEAPEVLRRTDGSFTLIRKRQTLEQITQNEIIPD